MDLQFPKEYYLRKEEALLLKCLENRTGIKAFILEGPPGTGKTFFTECLASAWGARFLYYLCHNWSSDEELLMGVNVGRVSAGVKNPEDAYTPGILTRAAQISVRQMAVICLDEVDKAPQKVEALLLDFLQHARVALPNGQIIRGVPDNLIIGLTTNGVRPLMEATLRRCFRITMQFLPPHVEAEIIKKKKPIVADGCHKNPCPDDELHPEKGHNGPLPPGGDQPGSGSGMLPES